MAYRLKSQALDEICLQLGGAGRHRRTVRALNEWATLLGGAGGHLRNVNALNEICLRLGGHGGHMRELSALNEICLRLGGAGGHERNLAALAEIAAVAGEDPAPLPAVLLIVAGQSNALAVGGTAGNLLAKYGALSDARIWTSATGAFAPYVAGSNSGSKGAGVAWGVEAEFIYRLNADAPGRGVCVVKEAVDGAAMAAVGTNHWQPGGQRFVQLASQVAAAKAALAAEGATFEEVTIFNQGEADTTDPAQAAAYGSNMANFLAAYRGAVSSGRFILERIRPYSVDLAARPYGNTFRVRAAQEDLAAADATVGITNLDFDPTNFGLLHPGPGWIEGRGQRAYAQWRGSYDASYPALDDAAPEGLVFAPASGASIAAEVTSEAVRVTGIGGHVPVSIAGGAFRVTNPDGTVWRDWGAEPGTIHPGQSLALRAMAAATPATDVQVVVTVGTVAASWTVTTAPVQEDVSEPETEAFSARLSALGGAAFSGAQRAALDAFYVTAKAGSWWAKVHRLYVGGLHCREAASIDLRDQTTTLTQVGTGGAVDWSPSLGWGTGGASDRGLDMHANPTALTNATESRSSSGVRTTRRGAFPTTSGAPTARCGSTRTTPS